SGVLDLVNSLKEKKFDEKAYKSALGELLDKILDAKSNIMDLQELVYEKEREIKGLKDTLKIASEMTWADPYFWQWKDEKWEGPFCATCWQDKYKPVRLIKKDTWTCQCPVCTRAFSTQYPVAPPPHRITPT